MIQTYRFHFSLNRGTGLGVLFLICLFSSCNLRKEMVYFQTELEDTTPSQYTPTFKKDDLLWIKITADDPETAVPFNLSADPTERSTSTGGYSTGNRERQGYLIDEEGFIHMPIIGKMRMEGLRRTEAVQMLESRLQDYLKNPVVQIQILNFKVTVLGDVTSPGTFRIPNERLTVIEAVGLAGDSRITGVRNNVLVIRDRDGIKEQHRIDLTDTESVFNSPVYYLEQNDVVYVEPNVSARTQGSFWRTSASIFISTAGVIISTISVLTR